MDTMNIFDAEESAAARDEAIAGVERNAGPDWGEVALQAVRDTVGESPDGFIVDHVWQRIPEGTPEPHEPRAMGAVMRRAHLAGIIAPTDRYIPSDRVTAHRNPRRVWVASR